MVGPMWQDLVTWATQYMIHGKTQLADPSDLQIPYCVDTVVDAIEIVEKAQTQWRMNEQENVVNKV